MRKITPFIVSALLMGLSATAQTVTYNFESDADGTTPPTGTTTLLGTAKVKTETANAFGNVLTPATVGASPSQKSFTCKLDNFPVSANYSVTWKFVYTDSKNGCKLGMLLRASTSETDIVPSADGYVGFRYGYLFIVNALDGIARMYKVGSTGLSSLFTGTKNTDLQCGVNIARWYRASVNGSTLTFDISVDGTTFTNLATVTDETYTSGNTFVAGGLGSPITAYFDDIKFAPTTTTDVKTTTEDPIKVAVNGKELIVKGTDSYSVFNLQGLNVANVASNTAHKTVTLTAGIYIIKSGNSVHKIVVQ